MEGKYTQEEQKAREDLMGTYRIKQDYFKLPTDKLRELYREKISSKRVPKSRKRLIVGLMAEDIRPVIMSQLEACENVGNEEIVLFGGGGGTG